MARLPSYERQAVLQHCVDRFKERFDELAYALCVEAGKPIKDSEGEVTRLIDTFRIAAEESVRMTGEVQPLDISPARQGLSGHLEARADRPVQLHLAVQLPAQPRRAQDRAGARGRLPVRDEAGEPHAARRDHHRRGARRDRPAQGRLLDPARPPRGRRPVHHRRAAEAAQLHRLARRSAGTSRPGRQEEGGARARRQRRGDRRRGRRPRRRGRADHLRRLLPVGPELHRRPAHPRSTPTSTTSSATMLVAKTKTPGRRRSQGPRRPSSAR